MRTEERVKRRVRGSRTQEGSEGLTVQVVVEEPAGGHNLYEYDQRRQALRLSGVAVGVGASPWERGHIVNTRTGSGQPLCALILVSIPTSPGCLVDMRVVGVAEFVQDSERQHLVLGVPDVDTSLRSLRAVSDLPGELRQAAQAWGPGFQRWLANDEVPPVIRQAREAYWQAKARAESIRYGAVWKVSSPPVGAGERGEVEPHTWAEYLVPTLPMRFQRHVEEMLLPAERILFFVERPEFAPPGRLALLRSQKLRQGLLVITDRQVLTMLDSRPPDSTLVDWGYVAKATAVERVESAWTELRDSTAEFNLAICAQGGTERYSVLFPREYEEALQEGVRLLDAFVQPGSQAVARVHDGAIDDGRRVDRQELLAKYPHLGELIEQAGGADEVLAAAAARGPEGRGLGPSVVVTATRALVFAGAKSRKDLIQGREIPIASISSVEAVQSVIACRFDIFVPDEEEVDRVTLKYDYPDSPAFVHAFITLRHLLGRPLTSGGEHR